MNWPLNYEIYYIIRRKQKIMYSNRQVNMIVIVIVIMIKVLTIISTNTNTITITLSLSLSLSLSLDNLTINTASIATTHATINTMLANSLAGGSITSNQLPAGWPQLQVPDWLVDRLDVMDWPVPTGKGRKKIAIVIVIRVMIITIVIMIVMIDSDTNNSFVIIFITITIITIIIITINIFIYVYVAIQSQSTRVILSHSDCCISSATGSGK